MLVALFVSFGGRISNPAGAIAEPTAGAVAATGGVLKGAGVGVGV